MKYFKRLKIIFIFLGVSSLIVGCSPSKVNKLLLLKKNQQIKQELLEKQTASYKKIKDYMQLGKMQEGLTKKEVVEEFGEPVISFLQENPQRWVYKAADQSWFTGEKVYLFFNEKGLLERWDCVDCSL